MQNPQDRTNLFPLFAQVDEKLSHNDAIITGNTVSISLPMPSKDHAQQEIFKKRINLYEKYVKQLLDVLESETVRKYCKKEVEHCRKIKSTFNGLIDKVGETIFSSEVK